MSIPPIVQSPVKSLETPLSPRKKEEASENKCTEVLKATVLNPDIPSVAGTLGSLTRDFRGIVKPFVPISNKVNQSIDATQFTTAFTMPHSVYNLIVGGTNLVLEKGKEAKLDNTLSIVGEVSALGGDVADFAQALVDLEAVPQPPGNWPAVLSLSSTLLSSVFIFINGRGLHFCRKALNDLKKAKENPKDTIDVLKKRTYHLGRQCGVNTELFFKTLSKCTIKKDEPLFQKTIDALKTRVKQKIASNALSITISAVIIIAVVILFAASSLIPLVVLGSSLLAFGHLLVFPKMILDAHADKQFENRMNRAVKQLNAAAA